MIDLEKKHLDTVLRILALRIPECEVWAFGSRVRSAIQGRARGTAKKYSDLDLAVIAHEKIGWEKLEELKLAMSESDLPISVDILDCNSISDNFRKIIEQNHEVLRQPDTGPAQ